MTGPGLLLLARRWWWLVGATALAAALVTWLVAGSAPKTYQAETKLLVGPVSADFDTLHASGELGKTYAELATSRPLLNAAARAARSSPPPSDGAVSATSNDVTRIVAVRVSDRSAARSARLADALAAQLLKLRGRLPVQQANAADEVMRDPELAPLARQQRQAVRAAVGRLGLSSSAGDLAVVERAVVPQRPVSPRVGLLVMIAAVAGALAALLFASIREQMVPPLPAGSEAAEAYDIDSLFEPRYGEHRGSRSDAVERWLDEVRSREAS